MQIMEAGAHMRDNASMKHHLRDFAISPFARLITHCLVTTAALIAFASGPVGAQEEEVWQALLRGQLLSEKNCVLNYTTNIRKFELAGQQMVDARAHCNDKRMFDVSWKPREDKFEIRNCEPAVC